MITDRELLFVVFGACAAIVGVDQWVRNKLEYDGVAQMVYEMHFIKEQAAKMMEMRSEAVGAMFNPTDNPENIETIAKENKGYL